MTLMRAGEIAGTALVAGATTTGALLEADMSGAIVPLVSGGVAALVGYFSAQITVRAELASLKTEMRLLREELHRYYPIRRRHADEDDAA